MDIIEMMIHISNQVTFIKLRCVVTTSKEKEVIIVKLISESPGFPFQTSHIAEP